MIDAPITATVNSAVTDAFVQRDAVVDRQRGGRGRGGATRGRPV